ncbi:MAG TPA: type II toxin-antitoxin system VapC family toxin [Burkholderiales bacterium]|nr:type II toxin-antitoxin system VapC family toxin [Burkholderiales bacterium]
MLVDTNVILDVVEDDPQWAAWSQAQLEAASLKFTLVINPIIYAELSIAYQRIEELETMLKRAQLRLDPIPREALFLAGRVFLRYRRQKGTKSGVLPDFFVGAHAAVSGLPLLTRDLRRYRTYFPSLKLIAPEHPKT